MAMSKQAFVGKYFFEEINLVWVWMIFVSSCFRLLVLVGLVQSGPMPQGITTSNDDPTLLSNPNLVIHYTSKENLDRLTTHLNLKENVSGDPLFWDTVFFNLWTPETTPDNPVKLMAHQVHIYSQNNSLLWGYP